MSNLPTVNRPKAPNLDSELSPNATIFHPWFKAYYQSFIVPVYKFLPKTNRGSGWSTVKKGSFFLIGPLIAPLVPLVRPMLYSRSQAGEHSLAYALKVNVVQVLLYALAALASLELIGRHFDSSASIFLSEISEPLLKGMIIAPIALSYALYLPVVWGWIYVSVVMDNSPYNQYTGRQLNQWACGVLYFLSVGCAVLADLVLTGLTDARELHLPELSHPVLVFLATVPAWLPFFYELEKTIVKSFSMSLSRVGSTSDSGSSAESESTVNESNPTADTKRKHRKSHSQEDEEEQKSSLSSLISRESVDSKGVTGSPKLPPGHLAQQSVTNSAPRPKIPARNGDADLHQQAAERLRTELYLTSCF